MMMSQNISAVHARLQSSGGVRSFVAALAVLLLAALFLSGCAGRGPREVAPPRFTELERHPQDLSVYAARAGGDAPLLDAATQAAQDQRWNTRFFAPWAQARTGVTLAEVTRTAPYLTKDGRTRGHAENLLPWDASRFAALVANCDAPSFPAMAERGIIVRNTALRELPTLRPSFANPDKAGQGYPFDDLQRSAVWTGTPVFVSHVSLDRAWLYCETGFASGWVPAEHVALADATFRALYQNGRYAAVLRDDVALTSPNQAFIATAHIGAVFPVAVESPGGLTVLVPLRDADGRAVLGQSTLPAGYAAMKPLTISAARMAEIGNRMMGQPYGWGGMYEDRDCSATLRDLFAPFGIWLPRNSASQAKAGRFVDFGKASPDGKEAIIRAQGVPFLTLLWLKGHITLYLGEYDGHPVMFHNIWGLRVFNNSGEDGERGQEGRFILGRAVVTSLRPGTELPNLTTPDGLVARMLGMSILPGGAGLPGGGGQ
ncbi:NlpC/P60 family N-terminal domain-containing protein [Nitratidesulfovibrio liaohensis]|uniref:SH3 domain-containing protein n=1 Tax=Nitratidesulfovibrio liaohensis TaxID=2604158 RepID=A0ABY9R5M6_9BACT|nr:NlpC/P60 family N-terminal domain-containing protein [Nitratidesulfovibrio liaohensis]WMW67041.1 SH3 domain-containing protein [Nitratidesulfovibrio liaohensis]